jgi:hypothetical protein
MKFTDDVVRNKVNTKASEVLRIKSEYKITVFPLHFVSSERTTTRDFPRQIYRSSSTLFLLIMKCFLKHQNNTQLSTTFSCPIIRAFSGVTF